MIREQNKTRHIATVGNASVAPIKYMVGKLVKCRLLPVPTGGNLVKIYITDYTPIQERLALKVVASVTRQIAIAASLPTGGSQS